MTTTTLSCFWDSGPVTLPAQKSTSVTYRTDFRTVGRYPTICGWV